LAELYTQLKLTDRVRPLLNNLRDETKNLPANGNVDLVMALLEADSWLSQTNPANASSALQSVLQQHPDDAEIANRVMNAYLTFGDYASARRLVERQLARSPDDVHALNSQAAILIQSGHAAAALPVLDHILTLTNLTAARLNRASARVVCRDFAGAETDFHELEKSGVEPGRVSYGLALIAEHRHDTNLAVHYLQICLTNTSSGTYLRQQASTRLQALEPDPGAK
jgi:Flp pilus assembly protein TadD